MRHTGRLVALVSLSLTLTAATVGCTEKKTESTPKLPQGFCWNAFERDDVQPILPTGERLKQDVEDFRFTDRNRSASCLIYIDGNNAFDAHADFEDNEDLIEWSSFDELKPDPVEIGKKGIVWDTGAITYFPCKSTADSEPPVAKFLELTIYAGGARVKNQRKTLPGLLEQFTAFAQKELKCA
ncbi:hypothetical protein OG333_30125 [Streptomyces anulatus]|uniref:hypothetical protein n=1 Tax=Streptomyces anulatus TaxID=1892 RepID=UPI00378A99F8|nr:hypothetical protein OG333_30125 [Streptomyces anulatus]